MILVRANTVHPMNKNVLQGGKYTKYQKNFDTTHRYYNRKQSQRNINSPRGITTQAFNAPYAVVNTVAYNIMNQHFHKKLPFLTFHVIFYNL